jgi:cyclohexyl-isocyanide hydratase
MKIAFVLFDDLTFLDLVGFYDPVTRLKTMGFIGDLTWDMCAMTETVTDDRGISVLASKVNEPLSSYDLFFIPGGMGTRRLQHDKPFIDWIRSAGAARLKISVCTGSLILGAAGFLKDKRATTHPNALEDLKAYCPNPSTERIVDEGEVVTGGGVAASLDVGLHIVERLTNAEVRRKIAKQMDYPYSPKVI